MPNDPETMKKRKINARASALRDTGVKDDQIVDAVMSFPDISPQMKSILKNAKVSGKSAEAIDQLIDFTKVEEPQLEMGRTEGKIAGVADFLGMEKIGRRAGAALAQLDPQHRRNLSTLDEGTRREIQTGGVSGKEALGSAGLTALNLAGGAILQGGARALGMKGAGGLFRGARTLQPTQTANRTVATIANSPGRSGAALGAAGGALSGVEQDKDTLGVVGDTLIGGAAGGALGAYAPRIVNSFLGRNATKKQVQNALKNVTPTYDELSKGQRIDFVKRGNVSPRTLTKAQQVNINDERIVGAAVRNSDIIADNPVQTVNNIQSRIAERDGEVEQFLIGNNGIFNKGELTNAVSSKMDDAIELAGLGTDEGMQRAKDKIINEFLDELPKNDMLSLWRARKAFDQRIGSAFSGNPSMQKEVKVAFRNAVQDFIAKQTRDNTYSQYMKDMSSLAKLRELVEIKVGAEQPRSILGEKARTLAGEISTVGGVAGGLGGGYYLGSRAVGGGE